jgi:hypothetical protein
MQAHEAIRMQSYFTHDKEPAAPLVRWAMRHLAGPRHKPLAPSATTAWTDSTTLLPRDSVLIRLLLVVSGVYK